MREREHFEHSEGHVTSDAPGRASPRRDGFGAPLDACGRTGLRFPSARTGSYLVSSSGIPGLPERRLGDRSGTAGPQAGHETLLVPPTTLAEVTRCSPWRRECGFGASAPDRLRQQSSGSLGSTRSSQRGPVALGSTGREKPWPLEHTPARTAGNGADRRISERRSYPSARILLACGLSSAQPPGRRSSSTGSPSSRPT